MCRSPFVVSLSNHERICDTVSDGGGTGWGWKWDFFKPPGEGRGGVMGLEIFMQRLGSNSQEMLDHFFVLQEIFSRALELDLSAL